MMMNKNYILNANLQINCQISIQLFKLGPQENEHPAKLSPSHIPDMIGRKCLVNSSE